MAHSVLLSCILIVGAAVTLQAQHVSGEADEEYIICHATSATPADVFAATDLAQLLGIALKATVPVDTEPNCQSKHFYLIVFVLILMQRCFCFE